MYRNDVARYLRAHHRNRPEDVQSPLPDPELSAARRRVEARLAETIDTLDYCTERDPEHARLTERLQELRHDHDDVLVLQCFIPED